SGGCRGRCGGPSHEPKRGHVPEGRGEAGGCDNSSPHGRRPSASRRRPPGIRTRRNPSPRSKPTGQVIGRADAEKAGRLAGVSEPSKPGLTLTLGEAADFWVTVMSVRCERVDEMGIGEFARRSRLSAKALRLYDELSLLPPARVGADSGYRFYEPGQ